MLTPAILVVVVAGIALAVGLVAMRSGGGTTGTSGPGGAGGSRGTIPASGASSGKAGSATPSIRADPPQAPATRGAKWITGPAGRLLAAVTTDLGKISAEQRSGDNSAARSAGARLTADARAALNGPMPPVDAVVYRSTLNDLEQLGADTASGDFRAATALLATANLGIVNVTAAVNSAAPANPPARVNDPSDT